MTKMLFVDDSCSVIYLVITKSLSHNLSSEHMTVAMPTDKRLSQTPREASRQTWSYLKRLASEVPLALDFRRTWFDTLAVPSCNKFNEWLPVIAGLHTAWTHCHCWLRKSTTLIRLHNIGLRIGNGWIQYILTTYIISNKNKPNLAHYTRYSLSFQFHSIMQVDGCYLNWQSKQGGQHLHSQVVHCRKRKKPHIIIFRWWRKPFATLVANLWMLNFDNRLCHL